MISNTVITLMVVPIPLLHALLVMLEVISDIIELLLPSESVEGRLSIDLNFNFF